jgi:WD40 repeat protein
VLKTPPGQGALPEPLSEPRLMTDSASSLLDGKVMTSASGGETGDKTARLWDAATDAALRTLKGHSDGVLAVAFSPDGKLVASASWDKTVRLRDAATGTARRTLKGHSGSVWAVAFSPERQARGVGI